jgi:hypothetical protein
LPFVRSSVRKKFRTRKTAQTTEREKNDLAAFAFERYFQGNALFGTVDKCARIVDPLRSIGVDEIACRLSGLDYRTLITDYYTLSRVHLGEI